MPIPSPKDNEKQNDYMGRCMSFMKDEKYDQKQKVAICLNTYSNPKNKSKAGDRDAIEIDFSDKIKEKKAKEDAEKQANIEPVIEQIAQPIVEDKIETPIAEVRLEPSVSEPTHTAVTAPAEVVNEVKVEETKTEEVKN